MATISISDLRPMGSDLFADQESYLSAMSPDEELSVNGGGTFGTSASPTISTSSPTAVSVTVAATVITLTIAGIAVYEAWKKHK